MWLFPASLSPGFLFLCCSLMILICLLHLLLPPLPLMPLHYCWGTQGCIFLASLDPHWGVFDVSGAVAAEEAPFPSLHDTSLPELISLQPRCCDGLQPCTAAAAGHSLGVVLVSSFWVAELGVSWFIASLVNLCLPGFNLTETVRQSWAAEVAAQVHADQQEDSYCF